jgi:hypothetical protein
MVITAVQARRKRAYALMKSIRFVVDSKCSMSTARALPQLETLAEPLVQAAA